VSTAEQEREAFTRLAAHGDRTLVIAPEFSHHLLSRCRLVEAVGGRLLGGSLEMIELASDKHRTAEHLSAAGVPVPEGISLDANAPLPANLPYPAVLKPRLGAGSSGVRLIGSSTDLPTLEADSSWRLERFCPGQAASVAVLCGPAGGFPLIPCTQRISQDGKFAYLGGSLPLEPRFHDRAIGLACRAVAALPEPRGYLGVDLVLGHDPTGRDDVVIEINPRLTTSYVGLRAASEANLAAALLAACEGHRPRLSFRPISLQFDPDGAVRRSGFPA